MDDSPLLVGLLGVTPTGLKLALLLGKLVNPSILFLNLYVCVCIFFLISF